MRITLNGELKECPDGLTIERLLDLYQIDKNRTAVELNLEVIPRKEHSKRTVKDSDMVEVVTFVGGG
ncbi:MAG TPA: sulfur carrier protein ThiS [Candidatus Wujingus californicus]|uniref:sulfur carrier protein ThiS n=1 Tax=Candidatus Wujingus californicus TaxID=3367618 RepID=UPI001DE8F4E4|nr:sulfur carrier protein ThiS [Planctomycetota bacterium]MDO8131690.1 sulfur carrier protein ThiS [Candidatus Brocadiales bacterium]